MIEPLFETRIYRELNPRAGKSVAAKRYRGQIDSSVCDITAHLSEIRRYFHHFTDHCLSHSIRIIDSIGALLKAIEFYEQQLTITRELSDQRGEGNALGNLGVAYKNLGDAGKAIEFYEQALVVDREIGDRRAEGTTLWNSALALEKLGDRVQAIARAEAALRICEAIEDPHAAMVRAKLAEWRKAEGGAST
jgi:tetratricopeptide (TPR) repeat protein